MPVSAVAESEVLQLLLGSLSSCLCNACSGTTLESPVDSAPLSLPGVPSGGHQGVGWMSRPSAESVVAAQRALCAPGVLSLNWNASSFHWSWRKKGGWGQCHCGGYCLHSHWPLRGRKVRMHDAGNMAFPWLLMLAKKIQASVLVNREVLH